MAKPFLIRWLALTALVRILAKNSAKPGLKQPLSSPLNVVPNIKRSILVNNRVVDTVREIHARVVDFLRNILFTLWTARYYRALEESRLS